MSAYKKCVHRKFTTVPEEYTVKSPRTKTHGITKPVDVPKLLKYLDENVIGRHTTFLGPYGRRKVVYCDYTGSGRALSYIEEYIQREVLPFYGNTHEVSNVTSLQSSYFRQETRTILREATRCSEEDAVIFCGHGCSSALQKLILALKFEVPPVVFVGPVEHQSTFQPWCNINAKIVRIGETKDGFLDLVDLENKLVYYKCEYSAETQFIGYFSAASNVTGILADDIATTILLHQNGAMSFWDYSTAAPYVNVDMNPILPGNNTAAQKDAIFLCGHKFVGGVQSPGVLIAKCCLLQKNMPNSSEEGYSLSGPNNHRLLKDIELREEDGPGSMVGAIRLGLAVHLKEAITVAHISAREERIVRSVFSFIRTIPEIHVLGSVAHSMKRLAVFSFIVKHPRGLLIHHNFICAILNDVFGIQARGGGGTCSGMYANDLLGIRDELAEKYEELLSEKKNVLCESECSTYEMLRPGFTRLSLPYFMSDADVTFVLEAVKMVATEGWKLLPQYVLNPETGEWKHKSNPIVRERKWIKSVRYVDGKMSCSERRVSGLSPFPQDPADCLQMARNNFNKARKIARKVPLTDQLMFLGEAEELRWFMVPREAQQLLLSNSRMVKTALPFEPNIYCGSRSSNMDTFSSHRVSRDSVDSVNSNLRHLRSPLSKNSSFTSLEKVSSLERAASEGFTPHNHHQSSHGNGNLLNPVNRSRCHSLESSACSLSKKQYLTPHRHRCSCGSHANISNSGSRDCLIGGDLSEASDLCINSLFSQPTDDELKAYAKEVSDEIMSEITTEIRGVIATVNTALPGSSSESLSGKNLSADSKDNNSSFSSRRTNSIPVSIGRYSSSLKPESATFSNEVGYLENSCSAPSSYLLSRNNCHSSNGESSRNGRASPSGSVSDHVVEYLAEWTTEMVTEVKSELRGMVSAVDEVISPPSNNSERVRKKSRIAHPAPRVVSFSSSSEREVGDVFQNSLLATDLENPKKASFYFGESASVSNNVCSSPFAIKEKSSILRTSPTFKEGSSSGISSFFENTLPPGKENELICEQAANSSREPSSRNSSCSDAENFPRRSLGNAKIEKRSDSSYEGIIRCESSDIDDACRDENALDSSDDEQGTSDSGVDKSEDTLKATNSCGDGSSSDKQQQHLEEYKPRSLPAKVPSLVLDDPFFSDMKIPLRKSSLDYSISIMSPKWHTPPKGIWKPSVEAIREFNMIEEGDRVLVCLSGGKDSLCLLHFLHQYQYYSQSLGINFTLGAITVDSGDSSYDPRPLIPYLNALSVHFIYEESSLIQKERDNDPLFLATFCNKIKRQLIYKAALKNKYNVIAVGQHLDDVAQGFLMAAFFSGKILSMKAHYVIKSNKLRVIRPLIHVREKHLKQFAESKKLPVINEAEIISTEHQRIKQLLAQQEVLHPKLFTNLQSAIYPLLTFLDDGREYLPSKSKKVSVVKFPISGYESDTDEDDPKGTS